MTLFRLAFGSRHDSAERLHHDRLAFGVTMTQPSVLLLAAQFLRTVMSMSREEVLAPFHTAFASSDPARGGCPTVP